MCWPLIFMGKYRPRKRRPLEDRFWEKVCFEPMSGCWLWLASTDGKGYGQFNIGNNKMRRSHRVSYELTEGPIPEGMVLDHLCRNIICVSPHHLEPVTNQVNSKRGDAGKNTPAKDRCKSGRHDRSDIRVRKNGTRYCAPCARENDRARWPRRKKSQP